MSYHVLSSNVIFGEANVPGYSFVTTPGGVLQIERTDAMDALVDIGGNVECDHIALTSLTTPNRVLTTDVAGRIVQTTFDANGLGNASSFTSGTVPGGRLQGGSYTLGNLTANSVTAGSLVGNISANSITSGTLPAGRLNGSYAFTDLTLSNALTASTLSANISANNITSGTVSDARMDGSYSFDALTLTGNLSAAWVHGNLSANNITTGTLHKDRLQGSYTFGTLTVSNVVTANAVNIPTLLGSNVLISNGNGYIVSSDVTQTELGFVSGVVSPIQTQINELAAGNIAGGNITNLDANNITFGILHDDRLVGNYSFANLELSDTLTANTITGSLDASYLTGTIPTGRISGSYTMANLTVAGAVVAGSVTGNMSANNLVSGTVPPARLAGESYSFESLQLTGNLTADSVNANVHASSIVDGIIDNARLNLEGLVSNVTPATGDLTLGTEGAVWEKVYANTVHVDDIQLGNAIMYKGNAVVLDLEQTTTNIVPAMGSTYSLGTVAVPWREVHAGNVIAGGDVVVGGSLLNPDLTPYLDLSNVETNVLPISGGLAIGSVDRPWASLVATEATVDTLAISGNVTTDLVPSTGGLDLGTAGQPWGNVHAEEIHANIDVTNLYGELDANIVFTGGSIDGFVIKAPAGSAAQPGIRFVDDEDTGLFLAATGNVGISCGNAQALSITADQMTVAGNVAPAANAMYSLGNVGALWKDVHVSNAIYAGPVSITGGSIEGVANLAVSGQIDAGSVVATGLISGSTLEGNLDTAFLTGTVDPARISGDYEVTNLTVTGNANIAGTTTVAPSGHIVPQANLQYDLGSAEKVWRDIYLSGSTIHLGNATIQESGGNVTISKLYIDGSITADGLLPDMSISNVQIVDESWSVLDDTAVDTAGGKIIVNGSGFGPGSLCQIGGTNATSTSYMSPAQLRVETGARTSGTKSLTIVRGDTQTATLPAGVTFSDAITWVTPSSLGNVEYAQGFTIPLIATSDSNILFSNLTALPAQTTLDPETGVLSGNITSVGTSTLFSVDLEAVDEELQNATRTFLLQLLVLLINATAYTDASWNALTQTALDANTANVYWTIDGVGMNDATGVLVDGTPATSFTAVDDSTLRVTGPQKPRGTYDVIVQSAATSKVLANAVFFSDVPTWVTPADLGDVDEDAAFSISLQATSDSNVVTYANVTSLPPSTTLNPTTGNLEGTITGVSDAQFFFDVLARDQEYQDVTRTFILRCLGVYIAQIAGYNHTLVLSNRGQLITWGNNAQGQTGVGTSGTVIETPQDVTERGTLAGRTITAVSCGGNHSVALTSDGAVHCWGYNSNGQCGQNNTTSPKLVPVVVGGVLAGQTVTTISCGLNHTLAIAGGTVYAWGLGGYGAIGNGGQSDVLTPVAVTGGSLSGKTVVQVGGGLGHSMALASDGTVHLWGWRNQGQIPGGASGYQLTPTDVSGYGALSGKTVVDIQTGEYHCLVLCSDNSVISWGYNPYGQVGVGNTTNENTPQNITNNGSLSGKTVSQIFTTATTSFAIASDGSIHAWGRGLAGAIGDGGVTDRTLPVNISSYGALAGQPISRLGGGQYSVFGMRDDATVSAWGDNAYYQLDPDGANRNTPVDVSTMIMGALSMRKLVPSDSEASAYFAYSVSLNAAGDVALVGAYLDDATGGADSGAAYVFTKGSGSWTQTAKLVPSDSEANAQFGWSVSLNAAGDVALVGARYDDATGGADSGAAYVFTSSSGSWTQTTKLVPSDSEANAGFGWSVSLNDAGDVALVGAVYDDATGGSNSGAAYVFTYSGSWTQTTKLVPSDSQAHAYFGQSVSLNAVGDVALVGAYGYAAAGGTYSGAAYVFTYSGSWTETTKLVPADSEAHAYFGWSVSLNAAGDVALVGGVYDDATGGADSGAAYVFTYSGSWTQTTKLIPSDSEASAYFGWSVSLNAAGDVALVGAWGDDAAGLTNAGAAYVFHNSGSWTQTGKLCAVDAEASSYFGYSVAIDSAGRVGIVGAYNDDAAGGGDSGAAYTFKVPAYS